jgi:septal ring factor EnvC (AmiA/AmiB activator)
MIVIILSMPIGCQYPQGIPLHLFGAVAAARTAEILAQIKRDYERQLARIRREADEKIALLHEKKRKYEAKTRKYQERTRQIRAEREALETEIAQQDAEREALVAALCARVDKQ